MGEKPTIISACLLGIKTRYNGEGAYNGKAVKEAGSYIIPVCPEQLGGLSTPREPAEITEGTGVDVLSGKAGIIDLAGEDVTENFLRGAEAVLEITRLTGAEKAVLKERSPSCGLRHICRGASGVTEEECANKKETVVVREGPGVLAALLQEEGLWVLGY